MVREGERRDRERGKDEERKGRRGREVDEFHETLQALVDDSQYSRGRRVLG